MNAMKITRHREGESVTLAAHPSKVHGVFMTIRKLPLLLLLLLAMAGFAMAQGTPATGGEPKMVIESFTHDFGEVKAGAPLEYSFIVRNQGKADLLIKSVAPG
jgi:hypothetical protein